MTSERKAKMHNAIASRAILRGSEERLVGPTGKPNGWLIDMRRLLVDAEFLHAVADQFWDDFADRMPLQIGGMEVAAIPLLSAILMKGLDRGHAVNGFIIRKERKRYGAGNLIEGKLTEEPIVIVDDIFNSGQSMGKVEAILSKSSKSIAFAYVLIDYQNTRGAAWLRRHDIPITSIFHLREFGLGGGQQRAAPPPDIFRQEWVFSAPGGNFFNLAPKSFPALAGGRIFFGTDVGTLWCLSADSGKPVWQFQLPSAAQKGIWSAPAIHDGKVIFGGYDGGVYCLDADTGAVRWQFSDAEWVGSSPAIAPELGLVFIGMDFDIEGKRGAIAAFDLETGAIIWQHNTRRYTHASPAYLPSRRLVACGSNDDELFLFDGATGTVRWRFQTRPQQGQKGSIRHAPAFDEKRNCVITGCADGVVYVVDLDSGREVWSVQTGGTIYTVPLVAGDYCYIGSTDKGFYILDLQNRSHTRIRVGAKVFGPASLLAGDVYFGTTNGVIYRLDASTHHLTGMHNLPDAVTNPLIQDPGTKLFYALTYMGHLYALSAQPRQTEDNMGRRRGARLGGAQAGRMQPQVSRISDDRPDEGQNAL